MENYNKKSTLSWNNNNKVPSNIILKHKRVGSFLLPRLHTVASLIKARLTYQILYFGNQQTPRTCYVNTTQSRLEQYLLETKTSKWHRLRRKRNRNLNPHHHHHHFTLLRVIFSALYYFLPEGKEENFPLNVGQERKSHHYHFLLNEKVTKNYLLIWRE